MTPVKLQHSIAVILTHGIFFGLYFVTVCFANRWLIFTDEGWRIRRRVSWVMVAIVNLLGALSVVSVAVTTGILMSEAAFVEQGNRPEDYNDPPWDAIVKCTVADVVALLADTVLLYRVWVVYGRKMRVMWFPLLMFLGGIVCTILQLFLQIVNVHNPDFGPYQWAAVNMSVGPGIVLTPFWASTAALNAYCTTMLIWRIWKASKKGENGTLARQLQFLVRILMESGILYLSVSLAHLFVWFGQNGFAIRLLGTINVFVIPIAFNLVLIRTAQNRAEDDVGGNRLENVTTIAFNSKPMISVEVHSSAGSEPTVHGSSMQSNYMKNGM